MTAMNTMPASTDFGLPVHLGRTFLSSLSWSKEEGERLRLTVITVMALLLFVPLALVIPGLDVPKPERTEAESLPPQLARLLVKPEPIEKPAIKPVEAPARLSQNPRSPNPLNLSRWHRSRNPFARWRSQKYKRRR